MYLLVVTKDFRAYSSHIRRKMPAYFYFTAAEAEAQISYFSCCSSWSRCVYGMCMAAPGMRCRFHHLFLHPQNHLSFPMGKV